jgi:secreted PhoX family phosphatase
MTGRAAAYRAAGLRCRRSRGYTFLVPVGRDANDPKASEPIIPMGRFSHEAVATDQRTGIVYRRAELGAHVYAQGFSQGGAKFNRLEGCWWDGGDGIYFVSTSGGDVKNGDVNSDGFAEGYGQVWHLRGSRTSTASSATAGTGACSSSRSTGSTTPSWRARPSAPTARPVREHLRGLGGHDVALHRQRGHDDRAHRAVA